MSHESNNIIMTANAIIAGTKLYAQKQETVLYIPRYTQQRKPRNMPQWRDDDDECVAAV